MIFKWNLPGNRTFMIPQLKVAAFVAAFVMAYILVSNTVIPGLDKFQTALIYMIAVLVFGNLVSIFLTVRLFSNRNDEFIPHGYFPVEVINKSVSEVARILDKMGYQSGSSKYPGITMQRPARPGPDFCENHLEFRPYLVNIQESNSGIQLRFFDEKHKSEFDGQQGACNAAQEFKRAVYGFEEYVNI